MLKPYVFRRKIEQLHKQHGHQGWWPRLIKSRGNIVSVQHHPGHKRRWLLKGRKLEIWEVMLGAILTQNTAWTNVEKALMSLAQANVLTPQQMVNCPTRKLESLIRPAGYYKQKAKKLKMAAKWSGGAEGRGGGIKLRQQLLDLWGVGPETADTILLYGFGLPIFVVDAYTRRLLAHLSGDNSWLTKPYDEVREFCEDALKNAPPLLRGEGGINSYQEAHALIVWWGKVDGGRMAR